ncbi:mariner Mos1 transposase [Trichonephila clavipes]|nr:mariner Mos1 transposase [Trichonephila clavipes]
MDKIIKVGRWVPHELTDRQQENRKIVCEMLLARYQRKSYLHRIVTGDEKLIYFENPKRNRSYVDAGQPLRPQDNAMYFLGSGGTNQYYELLKPGETVNTNRYKQQLLNLNDAILVKRK